MLNAILREYLTNIETGCVIICHILPACTEKGRHSHGNFGQKNENKVGNQRASFVANITLKFWKMSIMLYSVLYMAVLLRVNV